MRPLRSLCVASTPVSRMAIVMFALPDVPALSPAKFAAQMGRTRPVRVASSRNSSVAFGAATRRRSRPSSSRNWRSCPARCCPSSHSSRSRTRGALGRRVVRRRPADFAAWGDSRSPRRSPGRCRRWPWRARHRGRSASRSRSEMSGSAGAIAGAGGATGASEPASGARGAFGEFRAFGPADPSDAEPEHALSATPSASAPAMPSWFDSRLHGSMWSVCASRRRVRAPDQCSRYDRKWVGRAN